MCLDAEEDDNAIYEKLEMGNVAGSEEASFARARWGSREGLLWA